MNIAEPSNIKEKPDTLKTHSWYSLKYSWRTDLYRYAGKSGLKQYLHALLRNPSYQYTFLMRLCAYLSQNQGRPDKKIAFRFWYEIFRCYGVLLGIDLAYNTRIGGGLYIPHIIGIVVHQDAVIGKNCHLSQNVTIGQLNRGDRKGSPVIGDNVYIAPGAVITGRITVGDNAVIGSNAVVVKDVPENAVVGGVPAHVISLKGSKEYIVRAEYM